MPGEVEAAFAAAMAAFGPFEPAPHLAVALSGGADSTAAALLLREWAGPRGGRVTALTVDHGLRDGSAAEAAAVGAWAMEAGLAHATLPWQGPKPRRAIQERARERRYALLEAWCAAAGVLHLVLGHHADDQDETVAMRAARRSGIEGLAGMSTVVERRHLRLLRPLLGVRRAAIEAWLRDRGVAWIEDPSNRDPRFLRAHLRRAGGTAAAAVATPAADRAALDGRIAELAARTCRFDADGTVTIDLPGWAAGEPLAARLLLRRVLLACGRKRHPVGEAALDRFAAWVGDAASVPRRTLGGCLCRRRGNRLVIACEKSVTPRGVDPAGASRHLFTGLGSEPLDSVAGSHSCALGARAVGRASFVGSPAAAENRSGRPDHGRRAAGGSPAATTTPRPEARDAAGNVEAMENSDLP